MNEAALQTTQKIDLDKALQLRLKGNTYRDIAKVFNCSHAAVYERLQGLVPESIDLRAYQNNKANLLDSKAYEILLSLTKDGLEKETYHYKVKSLKELNEMARLERNEATQIVESRSFQVHASASKLFKTV